MGRRTRRAGRGLGVGFAAFAFTRTVAANLEQGLQIGSDLPGLDLRALFARVGANGGDALPTSAERAPTDGASGPEHP